MNLLSKAYRAHTGPMATKPAWYAFFSVLLFIFLITPPLIQANDDNLLSNSRFAEGLPVDWELDAFRPNDSLFHWYPHLRLVGIRIPAQAQPNDARWIQDVHVEPGEEYILSGYIKTRDVTPSVSECNLAVNAGANLSILQDVQPNGKFNYSEPLLGNNWWRFREVRFIALDSNDKPVSKVTIALRVGMFSCLTTGDAWFRRIKLEKLSD